MEGDDGVGEGRRATFMNDENQEKEQWEWSYSMMTGIMYGPIPVGIIVVAILGAVYYLFLR